jgi:hypothetical protein
MQKVEGSSPFIRFRFKRFRAGTHGFRAPNPLGDLDEGNGSGRLNNDT